MARIAIQQDIDDPDNVQDITEIARQMSKLGHKDEAAMAYQAVIEKHSEHPETHEAYERLILDILDPDEKNQPASQIDRAARLARDYAAKYVGRPEYMSAGGKHPGFVQTFGRIVELLQERNQAADALVLAERLTAGQDKLSAESVKALATSQITTGKLEEAAATTETLLTAYEHSEDWGQAVNETAEAWRLAGQLDTAMGMYEQVMGVAKGTKAEAMARAGRMTIWIDRGQNELMVQESEAIFRDVPQERFVPLVGEILVSVAERCQDKMTLSSAPPTEEELSYPTQFYEAILARDPNFVPQPKTAYFLALCYQRMNQPDKATRLYNSAVRKEPELVKDYEQSKIQRAGDRYCGAYTVWHLLKYYGKTVPVSDISDRIGIGQKGYATIKDIVMAFAYYGIESQAVQVPVEKGVGLNRSFVQYRITAGINLGHFVLCIPDGSGKAIVLDGTKEPSVIDLSAYRTDDAVWDGTVVLISPSREEFIGKLVSAQIDWKTINAMGQCWMSDSTVLINCVEKTGIYYAKLNEKKQACIRGGCTDLDCKDTKPNCVTNKECSTSASPCHSLENTEVCNDWNVEEECLANGTWGVPCIYDQARNCWPKAIADGACNLYAGQCRTTGEPMPCGTWMHQCHDGLW